MTDRTRGPRRADDKDYANVRETFPTRGRCRWHDTEMLKLLSGPKRGEFYCALCASEYRVTRHAKPAKVSHD